MYQKSVETSHQIRFPYYGTNKCEPTELFLTTKRTSKFVIIKKETCMLIDVAISGDSYVIKKEAENVLNIKTL
jgi:hypothetical protein